MRSILSTFEEIARNEGITISALERKIGASKGVLSRAITNGTDIQSKWLISIVENYPQYNPEWLLTGNGPMMKTEGEKKDESGGDLHADERHDAGQLPLATPATIPGEGIPLLPIDAMAGALTSDVSVLPYECEYYYVPVFTGADFLITVSGNSMNPTFQSGDIVACKRVPLSGLFFQWGKIYIIDTTQGPLIKRIKPAPSPDHITIVSDNTDYDPFQLPASEIRAVALVVGVIRLE